MPDFNSIRFQSARPLLQEITAERLNAILQEIRRNKPLPGRGITTRQEGGGVRIDLAAKLRGGASSPTPPQPWDLIARPDPESNSENPPYIVRVQPGTLNGILPSNWDIEEDVAGTGLFYAKAVIATDGEAVTGVTIEIDNSPPDAQQPVEFGIASSVEYLFGLFAEGQAYRVIGAGHIVLAPEQWFVTPANPAASAGESPYDIYYQLQ
jgi:hypothetical protein